MTPLLGLNARICECNDGTYHNCLFSYGPLLAGSLVVYHILYIRPTRASVNPPVSWHTAESLFLSSEHALVALCVEHPLEVVVVTTTLCKT